MTGDSRSIALDISEHLFRLTTESLRLHSNEIGRYGTLATLLNERITATCPLDDHALETIRDHLSAVPTQGKIRIKLNITKSSADDLAEVKERFARSLGSKLTVGDTLSILLFHYVACQKAASVMRRLGLENASDYSETATSDDKRRSQKVSPIR
jgi:hypothetical protein